MGYMTKETLKDPHTGKPLPSAKRQRILLQRAYKHEQYTGTQRGIGTGKGRAKGTPHKVNHLAREAIHAANKIVKDPSLWTDAVRKLTALGLLNPNGFETALKRAPRNTPKGRAIPDYSDELISDNLREPTLEEIAAQANMPAHELAHMQHTEFYALLRQRAIMASMTEGEQAVLNALQTHQMEQIARRMPKRASIPKRPLRRL